MKIRDVEKLKFIELKDALKIRGCSAKGNKLALTARLKDAIEKNLEVVCDMGEGEVIFSQVKVSALVQNGN